MGLSARELKRLLKEKEAKAKQETLFSRYLGCRDGKDKMRVAERTTVYLSSRFYFDTKCEGLSGIVLPRVTD